MRPAADIVERFRSDLDRLVPAGARLGVAVSGGADSLALLLLAATARPAMVEAATVDHRLRVESVREAESAAGVCGSLNIPHRTLAANWSEPPTSNMQAKARAERYRLLGTWARERGLVAVATAHHLDDQAETVLLRLARGSGVGGLAGMRASRRLGNGEPEIALVRPLLGWRRETLQQLVAEAGLPVADDPSNRNDRFDRTRARRLLGEAKWLEPSRLAMAASNARDADDALDWAAQREFAARHTVDENVLTLDAADLPRELRRRLLLAAIALASSEEEPPGPQLMQALETLNSGGVTTLCGLKLEGGTPWRISPAPPRRR